MNNQRTLREEFEKAIRSMFDGEPTKRDWFIAQNAARWMAERIAIEADEPSDFGPFITADEIRQLAKELS